MFRIQLLVTGDMEKAALHKSLQRFFPERRGGRKVEWLTPVMLKGVTTHRLRPGGAPSEPMISLAKALLAEARRSKNGVAPDLVLAVDDVELGNLDQEQTVVEHLRAALSRVLSEQKDPLFRGQAEELLKNNCSFHMFCPMAEPYFFRDPCALLAAGVPASQTPKLLHPDVERFETNDPAWLATCAEENRRRTATTPWWRHERHPKHYLAHLARRGGVSYDEVVQGKKALMELDWRKVPIGATGTRIIRSLFEDVSSWFEEENPIGTGETHPNLFPEPQVNPSQRVLRNL
jgi:hypothetical protein